MFTCKVEGSRDKFEVEGVKCCLPGGGIKKGLTSVVTYPWPNRMEGAAVNQLCEPFWGVFVLLIKGKLVNHLRRVVEHKLRNIWIQIIAERHRSNDFQYIKFRRRVHDHPQD